VTGQHGAASERRRVFQQHDRIVAEQHQHLIDAELRQTRRELMADVKRRGGRLAVPMFDDYFLSIADRPAVLKAIIDAASALSAATSCDLQTCDSGVLRMMAHRGFSEEFTSYFATVKADTTTPCSAALVTRKPVFVDDVAHSPIVSDLETRDVILEAGSRAIQSFPLLSPSGAVLGVLSFHYSRFAPGKVGTELIAAGASRALARVNLAG
jgi:hypothetical protein